MVKILVIIYSQQNQGEYGDDKSKYTLNFDLFQNKLKEIGFNNPVKAYYDSNMKVYLFNYFIYAD